MKIKVLIAGVFLLGVFPCFSWAEAPKLVAENPDFHFGQIYQGARLEHTFRVDNNGDAPLVIEKISSSCGCTAALMSEMTIAPQASAELKVAFDSARFSGPVVKTVYVYTNDPLNRVAQFYIRGKVLLAFLVYPMSADFGVMEAGKDAEVLVTITNSAKQSVKILNTETNLQEVRASVSTDTLAPGEKAELHIHAAPVEGKTELKGFVVVTTDSEYTPTIKIPVRLKIAASSTP